MSRKGENIRKRKDGRWEGRYTCKKEDGTKKIRSVYSHTYGGVKKKLTLAKAGREEPENCEDTVLDKTNSNCTNTALCKENSMIAAAEEWLASVQNEHKYSTYVKYRSVYQKYIKSCMEQFQNPLQASVITDRELYSGNVLSDSTKRTVAAVFRAILKYAGEKYRIHNITLSLSGLSAEPKGIEVFNIYDQTKLLHFVYEDMDIYKMGIVLGLSTGLRLGELCSLKWNDINLEMKFLHVNSTVQRIAVEGKDTKTILMETEPKSKYSRREIPLSDDIVSLLLKYQNPHTYVIGGERPVEPRTYQNKFKKYLKESGISDRNFHVLRHTFATNCINNGIDVKSLSEILGHSDVRITLNKYVHPSFELKRKHMNSLSSIYGQYLGQIL